jgi:hypothetical protein
MSAPKKIAHFIGILDYVDYKDEIPCQFVNLFAISVILGICALLGSTGHFLGGMSVSTIQGLGYGALAGGALFFILYNLRQCLSKETAPQGPRPTS